VSEDPLTELDLDVVTITRDASGTVEVDGGGLCVEDMVFLLEAARFQLLAELLWPRDDDDDEVEA
jgi:hypothetical protein